MGFSNANVSKIPVIRLWAVIGNNMVFGYYIPRFIQIK